MDGILSGLQNVASYINDIVVTCKIEQEHLQNLDNVLTSTRLEQAGLRLNHAKSAYMLPSIQYLGHIISTKGIQTFKEKVRALQLEAPAPTNTQQLRSFLGAVNYYKKFISNLSSVLSPLNKLLQKGVKWTWGEAQRKRQKGS